MKNRLSMHRRAAPGEKTQTIAASVPDGVAVEVEKIAKARGISRAWAAGRLIEDALKKEVE